MKGHILILTANILFGISVPVFKHLLNTGMPPEAIAFLRAAVTCALFWLLSLFLPRQRMTHRDLGLLAVCGICGVGINQLLFVVGLKMTSPVDGSIIASSTPIFALLLAAVILREPVTKRKVLGVCVGREQSPRRCNDSRQLHSLFPLPRVVAILGATLFSRDDYEVDVPRGDRGVIPVFSRRTGKCCRFSRSGIPTDATLRVALYYGRLHIHRLSACHLLSEKPPADNGKHVQLRSADGSLRHCDSHRSGRIFNLKAGVAVACIHGCVSRHYKPPQA